MTLFLASASQVSSFTIVLTCTTDTFISLVSMKRWKFSVKTTNVYLSINNEDCSANSLEYQFVKCPGFSWDRLNFHPSNWYSAEFWI